jgi:hypothetical protein
MTQTNMTHTNKLHQLFDLIFNSTSKNNPLALIQKVMDAVKAPFVAVGELFANKFREAVSLCEELLQFALLAISTQLLLELGPAHEADHQ